MEITVAVISMAADIIEALSVHQIIKEFAAMKKQKIALVYNLFRLHVPRIKLEISKRNYIYNAIKLWNTCIGKIL